MSMREKIAHRLDIQAKNDGEAENVKACRIVLSHCGTSREWQALTTVRHQRYGVLSYEVHSFYAVQPWVFAMCRDLLAD